MIMPMLSRKVFATNSLRKLLCGMYGLMAKLDVPRLNICQILMRYFSSYILYFSLQSVAQSPEIRATLAGAKPESFVLTPDQCSENNKLSNARCFTIVRIYFFILLVKEQVAVVKVLMI